MKFFVAALLGTTSTAVLAGGESAPPASIAWRLYTTDLEDADPLTDAVHHEVDGESLSVGFEYYWNGEAVGRGLAGLAELYELIKGFKGDSIVLQYRSFDPKPEGLGWILRPSILDHWEQFEDLLRERDVSLTIKFSSHPMGVVTGHSSSENPFLKSENPPRRD